MCQRQIACGSSVTAVSKHVLDLIDILVEFAQDGTLMSGGGSSRVAWNLLAAIGITHARYKPSPRATFLAISLAYFLLHQIMIPPKGNKVTEVSRKGFGQLPSLRTSTIVTSDCR